VIVAEEERETKETTQLDPIELGALLRNDDALGNSPHPIGSDPLEADRPTQTIARDELLGLIDQSAPPPPPSPHTVSRERLRTPSAAPMRALAKPIEAPIEAPFEEPLDTDISPSLSPLLVFGVISILVAVFVAITRMS